MYTTIQKFKIYFFKKLILLFSKDAKIYSKGVTFKKKIASKA